MSRLPLVARAVTLSVMYLLLSGWVSAWRQTPSAPSSPDPAKKAADRLVAAQASPTPPKAAEDDKPIVTRHEARIGDRAVKYTVTTGFMPLKNEAGEVEARMFFMAYTADVDQPKRRPLMFSFNGGPGSSSVWLHLGAIGPRRVKMQDEGWMPPPPYQLVNNEHSWLDRTDLVFIDPVGTGYSRPAKAELGKKYFGLQGDIESVGEFIRLYLTQYERWASPLFLVGESYGTTRAAGLAGHLIDRGIAFNGIVLVSAILNFQTAEFTKGNDLPFVLLLPTYTATAWYHKKLPAEFTELRQALAESERWASTEYMLGLSKGDQLGAEERRVVIDHMSRLTGLDKAFIDNCDLRVELSRFNAELLRDQKRTVGRLDSRFTGINDLPASASPDFDPSMAAIRPPYTTTFNDYVRSELGFNTDLTYHILGGFFREWDFGSDNRFADTSEALRSAFAKNPSMKLFVASGYYDGATPYFATRYTLSHMGLDPSLRKNITASEYEAGHMMYIQAASLSKLKRDVSAFIDGAAPGR